MHVCPWLTVSWHLCASRWWWRNRETDGSDQGAGVGGVPQGCGQTHHGTPAGGGGTPRDNRRRQNQTQHPETNHLRVRVRTKTGPVFFPPPMPTACIAVAVGTSEESLILGLNWSSYSCSYARQGVSCTSCSITKLTKWVSYCMYAVQKSTCRVHYFNSQLG